MIDLHTHILPGIDDGAKDMADAVAMARQALERKVAVIAATPHYLNREWTVIKQRHADLEHQLSEQGIDLKVIVGAELFIDPELMEMPREKIPTYNDAGKYCLIEFPMQELPAYTDEVLFALQVKGIIPIIAHPERYRYVAEDPNLVFKWITNGCLIQVNAGSLLGLFGEQAKQTGIILLQHSLVHLLASDAHSTGRRSFCLDKCLAIAQQYVTSEVVDLLVNANPGLVVEGKPIDVDVPEPVQYQPRKRFWLFKIFGGA